MKNNIIETVSGFLVLMIAIFFCIKIYNTSNRFMDKSYKVKAFFNQVDGLLEGNEVRLNGVKIGRVDNIMVDKDSYKVSILMNISKSYKLPIDSEAKIMSESFLGGKYVSIVPGEEEQKIKDLGQITVTQSSVQLEDLLGRVMFGGAIEQKK
jgi:phospholipid/cholesterol/gamma-HCH transport system substrate-binding protein